MSAPRNKIYVAGNFFWKGLRASLDNETVLGLYTNTSKNASKKDYSLLNLKLSYTMQYKSFIWTPFFDINNITNTKYSIVSGFPMPGINVMGGVKAKF